MVEKKSLTYDEEISSLLPYGLWRAKPLPLQVESATQPSQFEFPFGHHVSPIRKTPWYVFRFWRRLMSRTFVAIDEPVHRLLRNLTHRTPLVARIGRNNVCSLTYRVDDTALPNPYYSLALFHSLGGMPLEHVFQTRWIFSPAERLGVAQRVGYFDSTRLDRRCLRDLRLRSNHTEPSMVSAELLAFGTGTLRARNDDAEEPIQRELWSRHGRLNPDHEVVYARIRMLHRRTARGAEIVGKECYESTNVIYGDVLGELEQIWDRRADTDFLQQIADSLQGVRQSGRITCHQNPPFNVVAAMQLHLQRGGIWKRPPETARALLRRIEFILGSTLVDSWPAHSFRYRQVAPESEV